MNKNKKIINRRAVTLIAIMFLICVVFGSVSIFNSSREPKAKIDLAEYPVCIDYGTLNAKQRSVMDSILAACEDGEDTVEIPMLTQAEFDAIIERLGYHFGNTFRFQGIAYRNFSLTEVRYWAKINLELYAQAKAYKTELDTKVDRALSTLYEGETEYKLKQVCKWIASHCKYKRGSNDTLVLLNDGGMCGSYAMLFYKMSTRLGVQTNVCSGYATNSFGNTEGHAWNLVKIGNKTYFYDPTYYDSNHMSKYLHSETSWGREYELDAFNISY